MLNDMLAQGGTRAIELKNAATLIRSAGEEITGVKTAFFDLSTTHTAATIVGHISRGMRSLCGENSLRQIPNRLVLKLIALKLESVNWTMAHFGDVRCKGRDVNTTSEKTEMISGRVRMTKPPRHLWASITSRSAFVSALQGIINTVNRFAHPSIWNVSEINDVLI